MAKPLDGIRILEWCVWIAGPGSGVLLGDLGAEIIKIEEPGVGDPSRGGIEHLQGLNQMSTEALYGFAMQNRNKKSIAIDVAKPKGQEIVYRLVQKCDVFLQNFRPVVRDRVKMDYGTLSKYNPKLIYCNISALGPDGPDNWRRGNDTVGQARSGFMSSQRTVLGQPGLAGGVSCDHMTSITATYGILAALVARERLGIGQEIATSLTGSMIFLQGDAVGRASRNKQALPRRDRKSVTNPIANYYECKDGKWILLMGLAADIVWPDVCKALNIQDLEKDPRFATSKKRAENNRELIEILDRVFATKTRDEWNEIIGKYHRIMFSRINELTELADDPQIIDNKYIVEYEQPPFGKIKVAGYPVKFYETPAGIQKPAPEFAQHTEEVLFELGGYSRDEIAQFKEEKVIE
jgi:crotonobetainyl-CoA:carnitine CoA-transferase CaiB-like acyl-CoA transferase